jgi:hypothetical protein
LVFLLGANSSWNCHTRLNIFIQRDYKNVTDLLTPGNKRIRFFIPPIERFNNGIGGIGPPRDGLASPRGGIGPPRDGLASPRGGIGPPRDGLASPRGGIGPPRDGLASPRGIFGITLLSGGGDGTPGNFLLNIIPYMYIFIYRVDGYTLIINQ